MSCLAYVLLKNWLNFYAFETLITMTNKSSLIREIKLFSQRPHTRLINNNKKTNKQFLGWDFISLIL